MKRNNIILLIVFLIFIPSIYGGWWDGNWLFKQELNITNSINTPQNYSTKIVLNSTSVGSGWNWANECSNNLSRARFVDSTETTTLPFWVEHCSVSGENITYWVKVDQNITSSGVSVFLYYNNPSASLISEGNKTFEFFMNLTGLTVESEGNSQDVSGGNTITQSGTQINYFGNTWKVYSGFTNSISISNTGTQILELDMLSNDCGEISAIKFDTDTIQEDSNNYRWCGTQTNWGIVPDQPYSGTGTWQNVYTVLNDFSIDATHFHMVGDDDGDGSTDTTYRNVKIRKYVSTEPSFTLGIEEGVNITLSSMFPENGTVIAELTSTDFTCSGVGSGSNLSNISLYETWSTGSWNLNETINVTGLSDTVVFNKSLPSGSASYQWNCVVSDDSGAKDWFDINHTIIVDSDLPILTINSPIGTISDVTPRINVTANENLSQLWYKLNSQNNITLCNDCISSNSNYLHLPEGTHDITFYYNDSVGNLNSTNYLFTIDMNNNYYDSFNDNSSFYYLNNTLWNQGNISYDGAGGIKYYQGVEFGVKSSNMNYFANQWNGGGNAGEIDITCPGGDTSCWFITQNGTNISSINIDFGVATDDSASYQGFIMYSEQDVHARFSPSPHPSNGNNLFGTCYISGQWYYDDNNGCDNPFTPISSDIILANYTAGIASVVEVIAPSTAANTTLYSKKINLTSPIFALSNITWSTAGTDANNTIGIEISPNGGNNWYNVSNGNGLSNITNGTSLLYRINFTSDGTKTISINEINITWQNFISTAPELVLISPINSTKLLGNGTNTLLWRADDNDNNVTCDIYINSILVESKICNTGVNSSYTTTLDRGFYTWTINVTDSNNESVRDTSNFTVILQKGIKFKKSIKSNNTNIYSVNTVITNLFSDIEYNYTYIDFIPQGFILGSDTPPHSFFNITSGINYIGNTYFWNLNTSITNVNYLISGVGNYSLKKAYIVGGEIK